MCRKAIFYFATLRWAHLTPSLRIPTIKTVQFRHGLSAASAAARSVGEKRATIVTMPQSKRIRQRRCTTRVPCGSSRISMKLVREVSIVIRFSIRANSLQLCSSQIAFYQSHTSLSSDVAKPCLCSLFFGADPMKPSARRL